MSEARKPETRGGVSSWSALLTDGWEVADFTLVGRRSFSDAEDQILLQFSKGRWVEGVREKNEIFLPS